MKPQRHFDLLVFDWDGTLFDSTALIVHSIQAACADVGTAVPTDHDARYVIGLGLTDALVHVAPHLSPDMYPVLGQRYRFHYVQSQNQVTLFAGTQNMLTALKERNHFLAVATGKSRQGLDDALHSSKLRAVFDATRTADETASKPNPQMLLELMAELDVPPARTLMIGDTTHDLQLAANAGVASVAVSYGAHPHETFAALAPRHVAHSVLQLQDWLMQHG
jgi:phosphoglycolate phosphatase